MGVEVGSLQGMRVARVFDGAGPDGRPYVSRPPVGPGEFDQVLQYLESAPEVFSAPGGRKPDAFDPGAPATIPEKFYTDGQWIWPAEVFYYLRTHRIAPEPGLVDRIRSQRYQVPDVDEHHKQLALSMVTGAAPPPRQPPVPLHPPAPPVGVPPPGPVPRSGPPPMPRPAPVSGPVPGYGPPAAPYPQQQGKSNGGTIAVVVIIIVILLFVCFCVAPAVWGIWCASGDCPGA